MPPAFVTDTITNGDNVTLLRLGRVNFPDPSHVTTPWGETRSVSAYEEGGVVDIPGVDHVLRSELLRGYPAGRIKPMLGTMIARFLPAELVKRFADAVDALIGIDHFRFQPGGCHALVELSPSWVELRREDSKTSVAVIDDHVQRVGHDDINALVWKTGDSTWSLGRVK
ncbi:MAG: hypothetical protein AAB663_03180 [Patescibacteria group bacterium]